MELEETTETLPPPFAPPEQDPEAIWYHELLSGFPYEPPRGYSSGGGVAEAEHPIDYSRSELDGSDLEMTSAVVASTVEGDLGEPNFIDIMCGMLPE